MNLNEDLRGDAEKRLQEINTRKAEITATLLAWKRDYFATGVSRSLADRLTLEAEYASLQVEARKMRTQAADEKVARQKALDQSMLSVLYRLLHQKGLQSVWQQAVEQVKSQTSKGEHLEKSACTES